MATKLFLRETTRNGIGTFRDMLAAAGAAMITGVVNTVASGTQIQWTKTAGGAVLEWISGRVPAGGFTLSGIMTFNIWAKESNMSANAGGRARVFKRAAAGGETELAAGPYNDGVEFGTTIAAMNWTADVADMSFAEDDRIVVRYYITNIGTMGGGFTCTLDYDGPTGAADGDSWFQITENVTFKADPIPQELAASMSTFDGAQARRADKPLAASMAMFAGALAREARKALAASMATFAGAVSTAIIFGKTLAASMSTFAGAVTRRAGKALDAGMATFDGAAARLTGHGIAAAMSTFAGAIARRAGKALDAGMSTFAGTTLRQVGHAIAASMSTVAGGVARSAGKALDAGMSTFAATISRLTGHGLAPSMSAFAGALTRSAGKSVAAALESFSATLSRETLVALAAGLASFGAELARRTSRALAAGLAAFTPLWAGELQGGGPPPPPAEGKPPKRPWRATSPAGSRWNPFQRPPRRR